MPNATKTKIQKPAAARPTYTHGESAGLRTIPHDAFKLDSREVQFAPGDPQQLSTPINMLARSSQPINHWYWGQVIHDMSGFAADHPRIPIDYLHSDDELVGYLDKFEVRPDGLHCSGQLASVAEGDTASLVMRRKAAGIPYQASIYFRAENIEEVQAGAAAQVNGFNVQGPAVIVRKWGLRGVAVCPYGADHRTQSQFSDGESIAVAVTVTQGSPMTNSNPPAELATEAAPIETALTPAVEPVVDGRAAAVSELNKFVAKFGAENGSKWFAEGIDFTVGLERFAESQAATISKLQADIVALNEQLVQVKATFDRGESKPVTFSEAEGGKSAGGKAEPDAFNHLGGNRAKIAAAIKLPVSRK